MVIRVYNISVEEQQELTYMIFLSNMNYHECPMNLP